MRVCGRVQLYSVVRSTEAALIIENRKTGTRLSTSSFVLTERVRFFLARPFDPIRSRAIWPAGDPRHACAGFIHGQMGIEDSASAHFVDRHLLYL